MFTSTMTTFFITLTVTAAWFIALAPLGILKLGLPS